MRWNGCAILGSNAMLISQFQADGSHVNPASTVLLCPLCGQNDSAYETLDAAKYKLDLDEGGTQSTQLGSGISGWKSALLLAHVW